MSKKVEESRVGPFDPLKLEDCTNDVIDFYNNQGLLASEVQEIQEYLDKISLGDLKTANLEEIDSKLYPDKNNPRIKFLETISENWAMLFSDPSTFSDTYKESLMKEFKEDKNGYYERKHKGAIQELLKRVKKAKSQGFKNHHGGMNLSNVNDLFDDKLKALKKQHYIEPQRDFAEKTIKVIS